MLFTFILTDGDLTLGQIQLAARDSLGEALHLPSDVIYVTAERMRAVPDGDGWSVTASLHVDSSQAHDVQSTVQSYIAKPSEFETTRSQRLVAVHADWQAIHDTFAMLSFVDVTDYKDGLRVVREDASSSKAAGDVTRCS